MKRSLLIKWFLGLATTAPAFANPSEWMMCNTIGDATGPIYIGVNSMPEDSDTVLLRKESLADPEEDPARLMNASVPNGYLDTFETTGHLEILFKTIESTEFGGATDDAALFTVSVNNGRIEARFADRGIVYDLTCSMIE